MLLVYREEEKSLVSLLGISGFFERTRSKPVFKVLEAASPVMPVRFPRQKRPLPRPRLPDFFHKPALKAGERASFTAVRPRTIRAYVHYNRSL
ncbi:MAG: hypothetical protein LBK00_08215 [Treponema sp.]|nr:hypothetical protein [Treponema sp.]